MFCSFEKFKIESFAKVGKNLMFPNIFKANFENIAFVPYLGKM